MASLTTLLQTKYDFVVGNETNLEKGRIYQYASFSSRQMNFRCHVCWVAPSAGTATIEIWGAGGSGAGGGAIRTDGTQRAFTEDQLKGVLRQCFNEGGNPNMIMVGAFNKQKLSGFTGGSTRFDQAEDRRLVTSIDVYESDFGTLQVDPNRFIRDNNATAAKKGQDALVLEMDYFAVSFLRDFALQTPAQTADADQRFMVAEYTLESRNEAASGAVYDLTTS